MDFGENEIFRRNPLVKDSCMGPESARFNPLQIGLNFQYQKCCRRLIFQHIICYACILSLNNIFKLMAIYKMCLMSFLNF